MHSLVRDALLGELTRQSRHEEHHERAARWLENAGETTKALEQWLLAQRPREALRLLADKSTQLYDSGLEATILRTIALIPRHVIATDSSSLIDFAVCHISVSRATFLDAVGQAAWHVERTGDVAASAAVATLRSMALTMQGDWTSAGGLARRAIAELGEKWRMDAAGRFGWNMIARSIALSEAWDDANDLIRDATIAMSR